MSAVLAPPQSPYRGLAPFGDSDLDALFFFGREREREVIVANLLASRLTVLYGASGVGKSSLLAAAVVRDLREAAPDAVVVLLDQWSQPVGEALAEVRDAAEAYLVLDQFEEYFLYEDEAGGPGTLLLDLPELLRGSRVNVLVSLREESLAQLDAFKARLPEVFANQVRLEHLDRAAARRAILGPLERWHELTGEQVEIEPALVDGILDEVAAGRVEGRPLERDRIEAPYLQLVLERIWAAERSTGSTLLRLETLQGLGGARTIVRAHLEDALAALEPGEQDVAAAMFEHLVTPSGTKIAHRVGDLAQYAHVPEQALDHVLARLTHDRIVHGVDSSDRYEIFHDVLAEPIRAWRQQRALERERLAAARRQRRLAVLAAVALVALGAVTGLAVWALSERSASQARARVAQARELEATALQQLSIDPARSTRLALEAARLEPGGASEAVLRQALIANRLQRVLRIGGSVRALAYGPGGRLLAAGGSDGRTRIYDASSGALRGTVRSGAVTTLAFSPDETRLATADAHGQVRIVESATAKVLLLVRHRGAVRSVAFDPGGTVLLTASVDRTARVWDARTGKLLQRFDHPGAVAVARFGPHGLVATIASAGPGHAQARLFDRRSGRLVRVFPLGDPQDVEFSPDGRLLAVANYVGGTSLYRVGGGGPVRTLDDGGKASLATAFSPDGAFLATVGADGGVRVWRVADGSRFYFFPGHTQVVVAVAWSGDGRALADASLDGTTQLAEIAGIEAGTVVATLSGHAGAVRTVAFAPDGRTLATGGDDGTVRVWDAALDQDLRLVGARPGEALTASFDPAGRRVVSAWSDGTVRIWDVRTRHLLRTLRPSAPVADASFSPDGRRVATASADGDVAVWDARTGARLRSVAFDGRATSLRFGRGGTVLLAVSPGGVTLWDVARGRVLRTLPVPGGVVRAALAPDGSLVATAGADRLARIYDARSGALLRVLRGHTASLTDVSFSADGRMLVTTSADARPRIWNVETGALEHVLVGHFGVVSTAAFSPDGRWVVTAGPISAGLWPVSTGRLLFYLRGHTSLLTSVSFSPDGTRILTSSRDGSVRVYACTVCVGLDGLVRLAETRLAR